MRSDGDIKLLRSAQNALLYQITSKVRSVSFDIDGKTILARAVFEPTPTEDEIELISDAFGYVIGDYQDELISEQMIVSPDPLSELNLRLLAYQRFEPGS